MATGTVRARTIAALAPLLSACAFITDFPDVEARDGAGGAPSGGPGSSGSTSSGSGGAGGDGDGAGGASTSSSSTGEGAGGGVCDPCASCLGSECPTLAAEGGVTVRVNAGPAGPPTTSVWFNAIVGDASLGRRLVGHAASQANPGALDGAGTLLGDFGIATGFVLDGSGDLVVAARPCGEVASNPDEVFFNAAAAVREPEPQLVVAGAFEAGWLELHEAPGGVVPPCPASPSDDGIASGDLTSSAMVPFIAWLDGGGLVRAVAPGGQGRGYLADVVAVPSGTGVPERIVAIGVLEGDPLGTGTAVSEEAEIALVVAGEGPPTVASTGRRPCNGVNHLSDLSGLRTSVAVDPDGFVWAAGTGCRPDDPVGVDRSFLRLVELGSLSDTALTMPLIATQEMAVTDVEVDGDRVILAGSYTGMPDLTVSDLEEGTGDGFVLAFERTGWDIADDPLWFRRLDVEGAPVEIRDLHAADGRVLVAGSFGDRIATDAQSTCIDESLLERRAFFAELDAEGNVRWVHVEGFASDDASEGAQLLGTAIAPAGEDTLIAMRSEGLLRLTCDEPSVGGDGRPRATMRVLEAP